MCGFILLFVFILIGCENKKDEISEKEDDEQIFPEEGEDNEAKLSVGIKLDGVNAISFYKDCYLSSIYDEISVSDKSMKLESEINGKVQTYYLTDGNDKIYMISRVSDTRKNKNVQFNVENTALAFVTLNPFFAHVDSIAYDILSEAIRENQYFALLCNEVRSVVNQKKDLYDPENSSLIAAFDLLLENMMDFPDKNNELHSASRAIDDSENYYPFKLKSSGNVLEMQVFGLNPNYYGTATHANGKVEELVVYSHDDFGIFDFITNIWDVVVKKNEWKDKQYGEITEYTFPEDGECKFDFSCRTENAQKELTLNILYSILDILGIPSDVASQTEIIKDMFEDVIKNLPGDINDVVNNGGTGVNLPFFPFCLESVSDFESYCSQVYSIYLDAMQASTVKAMGKLSGNASLSQYAKEKLTSKYSAIYKRLGTAKKSLFLQYSLPKSILNIIGRLGAYHTAKDVVLFDLCCYNDKIEVCNKLYKLAGDEQLGMPGEELEIPLTLNAHIDFPESPSDYVVKFSVEEGGGTLSEEVVNVEEYKNEMTKWTLGHSSKTQKVKASLLLKETGEEVCEPVYFTAIAVDVNIVKISGDGQEAVPFEMLALPLAVKLEGYLDDVNSFRVKFEVVSGGGQVFDELVAIEDNKASTTWTLGGEEEQTVRVVLVDKDNQKEYSESVFFTAKIKKQIFIVSGDKQGGYMGEILTKPLVVGIWEGADVTSYQVKFEVVSGGGKVLNEYIPFDNNEASTFWRLGENNSEEQRVIAVLIDSEGQECSESISFTALTGSRVIKSLDEVSTIVGYNDTVCADLHVYAEHWINDTDNSTREWGITIYKENEKIKEYPIKETSTSDCQIEIVESSHYKDIATKAILNSKLYINIEDLFCEQIDSCHAWIFPNNTYSLGLYRKDNLNDTLSDNREMIKETYYKERYPLNLRGSIYEEIFGIYRFDLAKEDLYLRVQHVTSSPVFHSKKTFGLVYGYDGNYKVVSPYKVVKTDNVSEAYYKIAKDEIKKNIKYIAKAFEEFNGCKLYNPSEFRFIHKLDGAPYLEWLIREW